MIPAPPPDGAGVSDHRTRVRVMLRDTIFRNATLFGQPGRHALWVRDGVIHWIGADVDLTSAAGPADEIDAGGALLSPGFCDSHVHLFGGGAALEQLDLSAVHSRDALARALRERAEATPEDVMICAFGANYDLIGPDRRPDRHALDDILPGRAVFVTATDFHCAWASTPALERAGILHGADPGPGAEVVMGDDGLATGELREFAAMDLVKVHSPTGGREGLGLVGAEPDEVSPAERARDKATLRQAMAECLRHGITSVANMDGNLYQAALLSELAEEGALPIHVSLPMTLVPDMPDTRRSELYAQSAAAPRGSLTFGRVKMFMDGVFDTWTALRTDDYPGRPGFRGEPLFAAGEFARNCCEADARGLQIATHAVGDGAVRAVLDGYEAARQANGARDSRHRVEHIDMLHPDDLPRLRALGVVASMQPVHPPGSSGLPLEPTISIMGAGRWRDTFAWKAIAGAEVPIAFGTDWPVSPLSPFNALHSALSRRTWRDDVPDQRLPLDASVAAYTSTGAQALFAEGTRGRLVPGQAADLVLIKGDPAALAGDAGACSILLTMVGGAVRYRA